jgi:hypothetical protein
VDINHGFPADGQEYSHQCLKVDRLKLKSLPWFACVQVDAGSEGSDDVLQGLHVTEHMQQAKKMNKERQVSLLCLVMTVTFVNKRVPVLK